jgi:hypothetical protein
MVVATMKSTAPVAVETTNAVPPGHLKDDGHVTVRAVVPCCTNLMAIVCDRPLAGAFEMERVTFPVGALSKKALPSEQSIETDPVTPSVVTGVRAHMPSESLNS